MVELDDNGKIRIAIIICAIVAVFMTKFPGMHGYALYLSIVVELVFLVLGIAKKADDEIVKIVDKIVQILLAAIIILYTVRALWYTVNWAIEHEAFGKQIELIIAELCALAAGVGCALIAVALFKG